LKKLCRDIRNATKDIFKSDIGENFVELNVAYSDIGLDTNDMKSILIYE
jgi:hypothetical protein